MNLLLGFALRRVRWMAAGWLVKSAARHTVKRSVDAAGAEVQAKLDDKLPAPVKAAADRLGVDPARIGGAALVAGRNSKKVSNAAVVTARGGRSVAGAGLSAANAGRRLRRNLRDGAADVRAQLDLEIDQAGRLLRSQAAGHARGPAAATEALLDLRRERSALAEPLPEVPAPVGRGRRRSEPEPPPPEQARMQRTYRPPIKAWDRPLRRAALGEGRRARSGGRNSDQDGPEAG